MNGLSFNLDLVSRTLDKVGLWLLNVPSFHLYLVSRTLDKVGLFKGRYALRPYRSPLLGLKDAGQGGSLVDE